RHQVARQRGRERVEHVNRALLAENRERRAWLLTEARVEVGEALVGEADEGDRALVDVTAVAPTRARRHRHHLRGLRSQHAARGVDALDTEVVHGATAEPALQAGGLRILHARPAIGAGRPWGADLAGPDEAERAHHRRAHVQSVGDHELDAIGLARPDHAPAFVGGDRHGRLAQDVHTGARRLDRIVTVQRVGQRYVDGVHILALQTLT